MEDRRCSLSLSVFFLTVLLDSSGESLSASKLCPSVRLKRVRRLLRRWERACQNFPHFHAGIRSDAQQVTHVE